MGERMDYQPVAERAYRRIRQATETYFTGKKEGVRIYLLLDRRGLRIDAVMAAMACSEIISWLDLEDCEIDPVEPTVNRLIAKMHHAIRVRGD